MSVPAEREADWARQRPEHADEADEQQKRLQHADAEFGRELGEQAAILLHALVRLGAALAHEAELVGAVGLEPEIEQDLGQPLPEADLEALLQPGLRHDEGQENGDDDEEDEELAEEGGGVALLHRIEEGAVPLVEPHLAEHVADEDDEDGRGQPQHGPALAAPEHVAEEQEELPADARASPRRWHLEGGWGSGWCAAAFLASLARVLS